MSSLTTLARPYARAIFDVARAKDALGDWERALHVAASVADHQDVRPVVSNPFVADDVLQQLLTPSDDAPEGFEALLALLVDNGRIALLPDIAAIFSALKDEAEQTLAVTVKSASALDDAYRASLEAALGKRFGKRIDMTVEIDAAMLGGAVIEAGDLVIDGSVRGKLTRLETAMRAR